MNTKMKDHKSESNALAAHQSGSTHSKKNFLFSVCIRYVVSLLTGHVVELLTGHVVG